MGKIGYLHIPNLYKNIEILNFKECYALEKIHGTSARVSWKEGKVKFFSGGEGYEKFCNLFNAEELEKKFKELFEEFNVAIFGEAYGGKQQGMSKTYGKELKFVVFDVKIGDNWLDVPNAQEVALKLELEFVDYVKTKTDLELLDKERDKPSTQAKRNGIEEDRLREGVVLRPLIELRKNNGGRIIVKHKRDEFKETKTKREVNPEKLKVLEKAKEIVEEWITPNRLKNIISHIPEEEIILENTGKIIKKMIEDIYREAGDEIIPSNPIKKEISKKTAQLFKNYISKI